MSPTTKKKFVVVTIGDERMPPRFWRNVEEDSNGCWVWTGRIQRDGYVRYREGGRGSRTRVAHRVLCERVIEVVPDELQLDHLCRVRHCVNPAHLEPVTARTNTLRGLTPAARNAAKTHCKRGHEFTEQNTYRVDGQRRCRLCGRDLMRLYRAKQKEECA